MAPLRTACGVLSVVLVGTWQAARTKRSDQLLFWWACYEYRYAGLIDSRFI